MSDKTKGFIQLGFVILFIAGSFALSFLLSAVQPDSGESVNSDRTLFVETVTKNAEPYQIRFEATGLVQTKGTVNIVPQVSGRITKIDDQFFEGGIFEAGNTLFQIEALDFELDIQRLQSEVASARTALDLEKAEADAALSEWKQFNRSKPAPDLVARKPQMAEAQARLNAAKAQLEDAKLNLDRASFSFPFSGRVLSSTLAEGQYVVAGQSYGAVFGFDMLEVTSSLEDQKLEWLLEARNPKIKIIARQLGQTKSYEGYLKRSASALDPQTRFATVTFGFKNNAPDLLTGTFVDVKVEGAELNNVMVFPSSSLQRDTLMWMIEDENKLKALNVDIIYTDDDQVAIRAVKEPITVVTNKLAGATEGTEVSIQNNNNTDLKSSSEISNE